MNLTGCPPFVTPEEWPHDRRHFAACLWAVMGMFANEQVTNGGAFATFALDTQAGVIVRGSQDRESAQSITILSVLIVTLLVAIGMLMFLQSPPVSTYTMDGTRPPASFSAQGPAPLSMPGSGIMMMGLRA